MATTKIIPVKTNIRRISDYVQNKEKTAENTLTTTYGCSENNVESKFLEVINDENSTQKEVLARHLIQSFKPGEVDADTAHMIGEELADKHLKGKYQYIISTHIDKGHIHNHILFNNVSFEDYTCYNSNKRSYHEIRDISDELCRAYGLSVIDTIDKNKYREDPYASQTKYKNTYRKQIKNDINFNIKTSVNYEHFVERMSEKYEIKRGKYTSYKHKTNGQKRFIRSRSLGDKYHDDNIKLRIEREFLNIKDEPNLYNFDIDYNMIDIESKKYQDNAGLKYWAISQNNKALGNTIYKMRKLGAESAQQLENLIKQTDNTLSDLETSRNDFSKQIEHLNSQLFNLQKLSEMNEYSDNDYAEALLDDGIIIDDIEDIENLRDELNNQIDSIKNNWKNTVNNYDKAISFSNELKYLSNSYNRFRGKEIKYVEEHKDITREYFSNKDMDKER
ncbi:relaxase/mobilization nuclease domain-containing protein [Aerococcus viridans]|uniref:relaxase/mobilization nuclease domain-containing protein n=1 Tax=Aerococcus viridans TaxID=1377 RepID=UPI003B224110